MNCRNCGKPLPAPAPGGRRVREFCDNNNLCKQQFHRKAHRVEVRHEDSGALAEVQARIVELEQEVMGLRNRLDLERRYHQDHQVRGFKVWLKKQPGQTDFTRRVVMSQLVPPRGSRGTYEAYLHRMDCSAEELQEFEHWWKALLLQS